MNKNHAWISFLLVSFTILLTNSAICNDTLRHLTSDQIRILTTRIMENTPENIHYSKSKKFAWVLLTEKIKLSPAELQGEVIKELQKKYTVYLRREEVPTKLIEKNDDGSWYGITDGFTFSFWIEFESVDVIKVNYVDWENMLAASSHWKRYRWTGKDWLMIEKSSLLVS